MKNKNDIVKEIKRRIVEHDGRIEKLNKEGNPAMAVVVVSRQNELVSLAQWIKNGDCEK